MALSNLFGASIMSRFHRIFQDSCAIIAHVLKCNCNEGNAPARTPEGRLRQLLDMRDILIAFYPSLPAHVLFRSACGCTAAGHNFFTPL